VQVDLVDMLVAGKRERVQCIGSFPLSVERWVFEGAQGEVGGEERW